MPDMKRWKRGRRTLTLAVAAVRPVLSCLPFVKRAVVNFWFALFIAIIVAAYLTLHFMSAHRVDELPTIWLAVYPDMGDDAPPRIDIENGAINFGISFEEMDVDSVNIFIRGAKLNGCTNSDREKFEVSSDNEYLFSGTTPMYSRIKIPRTKLGDRIVKCQSDDVPTRMGFARRAIKLQLDAVLVDPRRFHDPFLETRRRLGKPARFAEIGFPWTGISDFLFGGLPSEEKYEKKVPALILGPKRVRLDAVDMPVVVAEWYDQEARELRDIILLLLGVALGVAGSALVEWIKSLTRMRQQVSK